MNFHSYASFTAAVQNLSYKKFTKKVRPMLRFRSLEPISNSFGFTLSHDTIVPQSDRHRSRQWLLENCGFRDQGHHIERDIQQQITDSRCTNSDHSVVPTHDDSPGSDQHHTSLPQNPPALGRSRHLSENLGHFQNFFNSWNAKYSK